MAEQRDGGYTAKQARTRARIAEVGAQRLLAESVNRLLASVAPMAIADECGVSPDTVKRLVGDRAAVLELVVDEVVTNLDHRSDAWPSFADVTGDAAGAFLVALSEDGDKTQAFIDALKVYVDANFATPARPAGTQLEAAVLTASPRWTGADVLDPEAREVAERLRQARADHLRRTTDGLGWLLAEAMAQLERRPQQGMNPRTLITLMNCLVDGAVLRMLVDPDCLDTTTVAEAVLRLGMAYTEPGSFEDPHEPEDPQGRRVFAAIVDAATEHWPDGEPALDQVAEAAGVDLATLERWFPTVHDLADSVVRRRVASVKPEPSESPDALVATLESVLRRLCLAADDVPGAVAEAFATGPTPTSIAAQITNHAIAVVEAHDQHPVLAEQLVTDACEGSGRWPRAQALLRLLERP